MPLYCCELIDKKGRVSEATREAGSEGEVAALFSRGDLFLTSVKLRSGEAARRRRGVKSDSVREFTIMMAALLDSGLALKDALAIAAEIAPAGSGIKRLVVGLLESVKKGNSFSKALDACGESFSRFYRGMIRIGERVGSVERVLPRLASYMTDRKALREKTAGALAYPALVCVLAVLGTIGILVFLVPRLLEIFSQLGGAAAAEARRSAAAMVLTFYFIGGASAFFLAVALAFARLRRRDDEFASRIDALILRIPLLGKFLASYETLNFAYAMETLVGGGVSVEIGLEEAAMVIGNRAYRGAVSRCRNEALKGELLSAAAGKCRELPARVAQWIAIGERSGQVERVFEQLRRYYQGEVDRISSRFMALIEPALILLAGGMIASLIFVFILPLFSMYGAML